MYQSKALDTKTQAESELITNYSREFYNNDLVFSTNFYCDWLIRFLFKFYVICPKGLIFP